MIKKKTKEKTKEKTKARIMGTLEKKLKIARVTSGTKMKTLMTVMLKINATQMICDMDDL